MKRILAVALAMSLAGAAFGQQEPTAATRLEQVKTSEDWLARAKSFHVVYDVEQLTIRADAAATRQMTETATTAPAQHTQHYQSETAFDASRFYTRDPGNLARASSSSMAKLRAQASARAS